MKKAISLLLTAALALCLASCASPLRGRTEQPASPAVSTDPNVPSASRPAAPQPEVGQNTQPATDAAPSEAPTEKQTDPYDWRTAPADVLFRPAQSQFVDQYNVYVFCTDSDVQNYVKMRKGPSKDRFDVVRQIDNYETVTVETRDVNGWTLCYYNGDEGWIRSDFLFEGDPRGSAPTSDGQYACGGSYIVRITDEYAGEPLNLRAGPTRDSELLFEIPDSEWVSIEEDTPIIDGWVYVRYVEHTDDRDFTQYRDHYGYVLYKYLRYADGVGDKPVLYLYPTGETVVDVRLTLADDVRLTCTYPASNGVWHVNASPDGTLTDPATGRQYAYLYWELGGIADYDFSRGFVVPGAETAEFLENTLTAIGLSARERNEFIVYWLPRMQNNPYNLIAFQTAAYEDVCSLEITPAPDSVLRVFMAYRALTAPVEIEPQTFAPFVRNGFTAVEWGGAEVR